MYTKERCKKDTHSPKIVMHPSSPIVTRQRFVSLLEPDILEPELLLQLNLPKRAE